MSPLCVVHSSFSLRARRAGLTCLLLACTGAGAVQAEPVLTQTLLWDRKQDGYVSHFVYGIGVTWDDSLLVACEGRVGGADAAEKDLLLKRSTDHGVTWSKDVVIEGGSDKESWSNPTFVTDGITTYLFYALTVNSDIGRVFYRTSTDNGVTWGKRTEVTSLWDKNPHGWTQHSSIGHGIKKLKGPDRGRVLFAFHHRGRVSLPPKERGYGNDVLALSPQGWAIAGGPPIEPGRGTNEARLAERADGSLYLMARQAAGDNQLRARSDANASGSDWSPWVTQPQLRGTVCDAGLLRFSDTCHLYSYPAGHARSAQERRDLSIAVSSDGGRTWGAPKLLHAGQATYSDLARDSVGNIYCIYGGDGADFMGDRVYLARFNAEWATGKAAPTLVLDDDAAEIEAAGAWHEQRGTEGAYGGGYRRAGAAARAAWTARAPEAGKYEVYVRWPDAPTHTAAAMVQVSVAGTVALTETLDQTRDGATWRYLTTVAAPEGASLQVTLQAPGPGLAADAVQFQMQ